LLFGSEGSPLKFAHSAPNLGDEHASSPSSSWEDSTSAKRRRRAVALCGLARRGCASV
jgi:hypothetical protein